jgi:hypothetical protein
MHRVTFRTASVVELAKDLPQTTVLVVVRWTVEKMFEEARSLVRKAVPVAY